MALDTESGSVDMVGGFSLVLMSDGSKPRRNLDIKGLIYGNPMRNSRKAVYDN